MTDYTLRLTEKQAGEISLACEILARLRMGQVDMALREFGFASEGQEQKRPPRPAKPVALRWPGTPIGRFAVMKLSRNPADVRTYY